jgi:hypothetical protein
VNLFLAQVKKLAPDKGYKAPNLHVTPPDAKLMLEAGLFFILVVLPLIGQVVALLAQIVEQNTQVTAMKH